jgi:hypothetical protein
MVAGLEGDMSANSSKQYALAGMIDRRGPASRGADLQWHVCEYACMLYAETFSMLRRQSVVVQEGP